MIRILTGAACASLIIGIITEGIEKGWIEGCAIILAILIIVTVTTVNNYLKD